MPEMNTMFSRGYAEVGHHLLGLGEDGVVAAAGAPADLLVGDEVLAGEHRQRAAPSAGSGRVGHRTGLLRRRAAGAPRPRSRDAERLAADPVEAHRVDQVAAADEQPQLAQVDLRDEHPSIAREDVAGVARERVEVAQVRVRDRMALLPGDARPRSGWRRTWSPSRARAGRPSPGRTPGGRGCRRRCRPPSGPAAGSSGGGSRGRS